LSQNSKIILGVDPGLTFSGYGVVELTGNRIACLECGTIGPGTAEARLPDRIRINFEKLGSVIEKFKPSELALEAIFYAKNVRMAIELAHIRGALILSGKMRNLSIHEYSPLEIKQAVVGYGKATKEQVHKMVNVLLRNPPIKDSHSADALAAAICHSNSSTLSAKLKELF
jgi:crossover junction endodeoxyribonuclease RuvC